MEVALVIDDSRSMRTIIRRILVEVGFETAEASTGRAGLDYLNLADQQGKTPRLVLVDWNMPEMSGLEFIQKVRERWSSQQLSILMVTSENELEYVERAMGAGASEYVMKPFTREIIVDKLRLTGSFRELL